MRYPLRNVSLAFLLGVLSCSYSAQAKGALPEARRYGSTEYLVGGIGDSETQAIEQASKHWPMTLEFAEKDGKHSDFVADVHVTVRDDKGQEVLKTNSAGPFLLARLAPGHYRVDATLRGNRLQQRMDVKGDGQRALFLWPAGTDGS